MKVVIGNMTFESDMKSVYDTDRYQMFLDAAVEVEKARANVPLYMPPSIPATWPQVPSYPAPIVTCSTEGGSHAGND